MWPALTLKLPLLLGIDLGEVTQGNHVWRLPVTGL